MSEAPAGRPVAVALSYEDRRRAPVVVAKGYGPVADAILREAQAHGLYVHRSPELVQLLMQVRLDEEIPPALYLAVATLLAWVLQVDDASSGHFDARTAAGE